MVIVVASIIVKKSCLFILGVFDCIPYYFFEPHLQHMNDVVTSIKYSLSIYHPPYIPSHMHLIMHFDLMHMGRNVRWVVYRETAYFMDIIHMLKMSCEGIIRHAIIFLCIS